CRVGQDPDPRPAPSETADDVFLEPQIDDADQWAALARVAYLAWRLGRNLLDEVLVLPAWQGARSVDGRTAVDLARSRDQASERAVSPKVTGEGSCVDTRESRDAVVAEK